MKKLFYLSVCLILGCFVSSLEAQNCENLVFTKGSSYEMEHFDSKNKKIGSSKSSVKDVVSEKGKYIADIHTESYDDKNNKEEEADFKMMCEGSVVKIDLSPLAAKIGKELEQMDVKMESSFLEIPSSISVGQTLPNGKLVLTMTMKESGQLLGTTTIEITNRKVESKESLTTTAGTFDTWKINATINVGLEMMGQTLPSSSVKSVEYYNKNVGTVKSEQYNKEGMLESYSLLTKYKKG